MTTPLESFVVATDVNIHDRGGTLLVGGKRNNGVYLLNEFAARVLREFGTERTIDDVANAIATHYDAPYADIAANVRNCAGELVARQLIRRAGQAPEANATRENSEFFSHMLLELTWDCNLRCKHCYMEGGRRRPNILDKDLLASAIREFKQLGGESLTLSGGEPMLYSGWDHLAEIGYEAGLQLAIMTNGSYLDATRMGVIRAYQMGVGLGVDGVRAETHDANRGRGSFAATMRAIDLLERYGYLDQLTVCFSPLRFNVYDLPGIVDMMLARGLPRLYVSLLEQRGRAETFWNKVGLTETQKDWLLSYLYGASRVTAGRLVIETTHHTDMFYRLLYDLDSSSARNRRLTVRVASEGDVFLSAYLGAAEHRLGTLGEGQLHDMLNSERATEILERWENRADRIEKCRSCAYKSLCKGGSATLAFSSAGTFDEPDEYCSARIKLLDSIVDSSLSEMRIS